MPEIITRYFPGLTPRQHRQFEQLEPVYTEWNQKINVISRKDIQHFYERHVLHSLAIAKVIHFLPGTRILDAGTGGGFPGIPLAILFPDCTFILVDSIGKKIKLVHEVIEAVDIKNAAAIQSRVEDLDEQVDFVVSRAVTALPRLIEWTAPLIRKKSRHQTGNGWLCLKGGDLREELQSVKQKVTRYPVSRFFSEPFFESKEIICVKAQ